MNNNKSDAWHNHRVCVLATEQLQFITPWSTNNAVYWLRGFFYLLIMHMLKNGMH